MTKPMPNKIDTYAGAKLKEIRAIKRITQGDLASMVGITFQQVQKYENGKNRMSASRLYQFSNFLQVNVSEFFPDGDSYEPLALSHVQKRMLNVTGDMDGDQQKEFLTVMNVLVNIIVKRKV